MNEEELKLEAKGYGNSIPFVYETELVRNIVRVYVEEAYLAGAEPREKRIAELEEKLANADYQLEGRENEIKELQEEIERLKGDLELWESGACRATNLDKCDVVKELEAQIEKMKWHDLEKDPNELPKNKRNVWCDYGEGYGEGYYSKDDGGWWIEGHMYYSIVDAWCELPTREIKEND